MVDPSIAKTLPDVALIAASKGGGGIPSWLALSELQSRNNIRASAPIQQPQGTVADDVVSEALRSSGIMGPAQVAQMPMAPQGITAGPQQTQPQQQMPQQPQSMAKGGPVRMADGGYADMLEHSGFLAPLPNIQANPINYTPAVTPDGTTLESASGRVSPLFGKGPDYGQAMSDLAELKKKAPNTSDLGHWLSNFAGAALASKGNAVQGFGQGLMTANAAQDEAKQREFENSRQIGSDSMGIQMHQDERQRNIANSVTKYQESQAGIADAQDRLKATVAAGNEERSLEVKKELANLASKRVDAIQDFTKSIGNPVFAGFVRDQAIKSGNKDMADLAGHSIDNFNAQQQKTSDIAQKREMAVAAAQKQVALSNIFAEKALEHKYKMQEMGMGPNGEVGSIQTGPDGKPQVRQIAKDIAEYRQASPSPMSLTRPQAAQLEAEINAWNPNYNATYYKPIQQLRDEANPSNKMGANVSAANTAMAHLDLLGKYGKALDNGDVQSINMLKNKVSTEFGGAAPGNFNGIKHQVAGELVALLKKNGLPDQDAIHNVSEGMKDVANQQQLDGYIDSQIQIAAGKMANTKEMVLRTPGLSPNDPIHNQIDYTPTARKVLYSRGFDPDNPQAGKVLQGLPGGFGKKIDHDTAVKFLQATGGDVKRAQKISKEFGWEQ